MDAVLDTGVEGGGGYILDNQAFGGSTLSQSLDATLDGITFAATQTVGNAKIQALDAALDGVTVAISQTLSHSQALAATLDGITVEINQSAAPSNKDQSLAVVLDGIQVAIAQAGPAADIFGGGFFTQSLRRKLFEDELRAKLKKLPDEVAEVIEDAVIVAIDKPKQPTTKELRQAFEAENIPYRDAYRKAVVSLVQQVRQREEDDEEEEATALAFLI